MGENSYDYIGITGIILHDFLIKYMCSVIGVRLLFQTSASHLGHIKRESAFEHGLIAQIQIILHMLKVSPVPLLSIHTFCSIQ